MNLYINIHIGNYFTMQLLAKLRPSHSVLGENLQAYTYK